MGLGAAAGETNTSLKRPTHVAPLQEFGCESGPTWVFVPSRKSLCSQTRTKQDDRTTEPPVSPGAVCTMLKTRGCAVSLLISKAHLCYFLAV